MAKFDDDEDQPKTKRFPIPKLKAPRIGDLRASLSNLRIPTVDVGIVLGGLAIAMISAGASVVGVRLFIPEKKIQVIRDPHEVEAARQFNPPGLPAFTVGPNVNTAFVTHISHPRVHALAYVHPQAAVIGAVQIGAKAFIAPQASIRGDEGQEIHVGESTGILDGAVVHGPPTEQGGIFLERNQVRVEGQRYSVYLGDRVTLAPQSQVYGPAIVGDDTYIGPQALVEHAMIGKRCVLEPRSAVLGVQIPDGHYVPAGVVVRNQTQADILPMITGDYPLRDVNSQAVEVNSALAEGYNALYPRRAPESRSHD